MRKLKLLCKLMALPGVIGPTLLLLSRLKQFMPLLNYSQDCRALFCLAQRLLWLISTIKILYKIYRNYTKRRLVQLFSFLPVVFQPQLCSTLNSLASLECWLVSLQILYISMLKMFWLLLNLLLSLGFSIFEIYVFNIYYRTQLYFSSNSYRRRLLRNL